MQKREYELMETLFENEDRTPTATNPDARYPNGFDSEPCMVGDAQQVIKYLLKNDDSLRGFKLVKRAKSKKRSV